MSIFEIFMLICFGAAWPFSIYHSFTTKCVDGKNPVFLVILLMGYFFGILHKIFFYYDRVIFLYILNFIMVGIDTILYLRYRQV